MPSPNVLDLSPTPRRNQTGLERVIEGYAEGTRRGNEADELKNIYEKYKEEGMGLEQKIQEIRTNPKIGNATKASAVSDLTTIAQINAKKQEMALKEYEKDQKVKAKIQEQENKKEQIADLEKRRNLQPGSLKAYEDDPKMAEQISRPPREGKGNQADRPISEDQQIRIEDAEQDPTWEKSSLPMRERILRKSGVSTANIKSVLGPYELEREEQIAFHKESAKYEEELTKNNKTAKNQKEAISNIEEALASGNVKPSSIANVFKGMGNIGNKISEAYLSGDQAKLAAAIPQLLEGWKEVFGVRLSDADLKILQDKLPSIGKSPEANKSILGIMKKYSDMTLLRGKIAKQIKEENGGLRPLDYPNLIEERFDDMTEQVKVINPENGKVISIPAYKLSGAMKKGAKLYNANKQ